MNRSPSTVTPTENSRSAGLLVLFEPRSSYGTWGRIKASSAVGWRVGASAGRSAFVLGTFGASGWTPAGVSLTGALTGLMAGISKPSFCHSLNSLYRAYEARCSIGTSSFSDTSAMSTSSVAAVVSLSLLPLVALVASGSFALDIWAMTRSRRAFSEARALARCLFGAVAS
uniref:(northern house mosquito) hypothetical protein n=1 Tax=Culex pipiens TaxID=7175 RepID=A0A8D8AJR2_CULPI